MAAFVATSHDGGFTAEFKIKVESGTVVVYGPDPDSITGLAVTAKFLLVGEDKAPGITWTPVSAPKPAY